MFSVLKEHNAAKCASLDAHFYSEIEFLENNFEWNTDLKKLSFGTWFSKKKKVSIHNMIHCLTFVC